jgi:integrase
MARVVQAGRSPATAVRVHSTLRAALSQAVRDGVLVRNVAALVEPPRTAQHQYQPLSASEARRLLDATAADRLGPLFATALGTGLRQGELLGLRWIDVDLDAAMLTVWHELERRDGEYVLAEPKSCRSRGRAVPLPHLVVEALRDLRRAQLEEKVAHRREWQDHGLVFTTPTGRPLASSTVTHALQRHLLAAGLPRQRFHDLRHFAGTAIVAGTADLRLAQEVLGHSTPTLTANVYAHVLPEHRRRASEALDRALSPTVPVSVPVQEAAEGPN